MTQDVIEANTFTFSYTPPPSPAEPAGGPAAGGGGGDGAAAGAAGAAAAAAGGPPTDPNLGRCAICLCDFEAGDASRRLPCLHMFHKDCIDDWLKQHRDCPVCKTDIVTGAQVPHTSPHARRTAAPA